MSGDEARSAPSSSGARWATIAKCSTGLGGGDTVVLDPPDELADGARVRVATRGRCRRLKDRAGQP